MQPKPILTFELSLTSHHRTHVITQEEAVALAKYFDELDGFSGNDSYSAWDPNFFVGKTVAVAGTDMDYSSGFADECIQHIICHLFGYEGEY